MNDFPSLESVDKIKTIVDSGELKLRGGEAVSASLQGGLKAWDTTKTGAQVANVVIETGLGTKSIGDAQSSNEKRGITFAVYAQGPHVPASISQLQRA